MLEKNRKTGYNTVAQRLWHIISVSNTVLYLEAYGLQQQKTTIDNIKTDWTKNMV